MINKPKIGEKCNGCGICCRNQVCMNGAYVLKLVDTCGCDEILTNDTEEEEHKLEEH